MNAKIKLTGYSSDDLPEADIWKASKSKNAKGVTARTPSIGNISNFSPYKCCYCEIQLDKSNYTREHLVAKTKAGGSSQKNLRPCCRACNSEKDNISLQEYIELLNNQAQGKTGDELIKLQTKIKNAIKLLIEITTQAN